MKKIINLIKNLFYLRNCLINGQKFDTAKYWENCYASGAGSEGERYKIKRDYINSIIEKYNINSVVDFGCGDGRQIKELNIKKYYGIDVSKTAVEKCQLLYKDRKGWEFEILNRAVIPQSDLAMSIDTIYHLIEENECRKHLDNLFSCANYVLIYGNYTERDNPRPAKHMLFRENIDYLAKNYPNWILLEKYPIKKDFGFLFYRKDNLPQRLKNA